MDTTEPPTESARCAARQEFDELVRRLEHLSDEEFVAVDPATVATWSPGMVIRIPGT